MAGDVIELIKQSEVLNLDVDKLLSDFKKIEGSMIDKTSIFKKTTDYMENEYNKYAVDNVSRIQQQTQLMGQLAIAHTAKAVDTALQMQQVASQLALSRAEIEFNIARTKLVQAQTETEKAKKLATEREIKSFDDNLRIKEAENLTNAVFGYASGGVAVPTDMKTQMLNAIDAITPSKSEQQTQQAIINNNLSSVQEHIDTKFNTLNSAISTLTKAVTALNTNFDALADALKTK